MKQLPLLFSRRYARLPTVKESDQDAYTYHYYKVLKRPPRHFKFNNVDILLSSLKKCKQISNVRWQDYPLLKSVRLYSRDQLLFKINEDRHRSTLRWIWSLQKLKVS
jgi:hypothetical protein